MINGLELKERKVWNGKEMITEYVGVDKCGNYCVFGRTKEECEEEAKKWKEGN